MTYLPFCVNGDSETTGTDENVVSCERLIEPLTPRELQILGLVCDGHSNQEISALVQIRLQTVKYHVMNVFGKLCVRRRTQAVAVAVHLQLVKPGWLYINGWHGREHLLAKPRTRAAPRLADDRIQRAREIGNETSM